MFTTQNSDILKYARTQAPTHPKWSDILKYARTQAPTHPKWSDIIRKTWTQTRAFYT